jgi:PhzF family phenazine biosynthesis protein
MMKKYKYIKSNAFTAGALLGNPAACVFTGKETLSPEQMQAVAREHKGFVTEVVFCGQSDVADCKLTYYSSECEVDFCGHGTIATMYSMIKDDAGLRSKPVVKVETNRKGIVEVFNAIDTEDAVYITAPDPIEHPMKLTIDAIGKALELSEGSIRQDIPIRIIDAGHSQN